MDINEIQLKESVLAQLQTLSVCKPNSSKRNWTVRCPYCGDSSNQSHGHFSILIDLNSNAPILYRCLRCNESGVLIPQVMEDLGLNVSQSFERKLRLYNQSSSRGSYFKDKIKNFITPISRENIHTIRKLEYLNNRLGVKLSFEDCAKYKIILSFSDFLRINNIPLQSSSEDIFYLKPSMVREMDMHYIGFLSANNNKIVFRDTTPDSSGLYKRYYKVTIDLLNRSPNTFYSLFSEFNLFYTNPINIHIAEGTFDILSVYLNLKDSLPENSLFLASCGYSFSSILKYLIYMGVTTDINLHIYSDNDKTDYDHMRLLKDETLKVWLDKIIVHRNTFAGEKDFGVPKNRISDYSYTLKI